VTHRKGEKKELGVSGRIRAAWPSSSPAYTTELILESAQFNSEDGGSMFLRNVGIRLQDYTVPQYGRQSLDGYFLSF
jgi:hypothetical protein